LKGLIDFKFKRTFLPRGSAVRLRDERLRLAVDLDCLEDGVGKLSSRHCKRVLMHRILGGEKLDAFTASSRLNAEWSFFPGAQGTRAGGREELAAENYDAIGVRRSQGPISCQIFQDGGPMDWTQAAPHSPNFLKKLMT
jgi:hypothetical protein